MTDQHIKHGEWVIYYEPPPIPIRTMDWHFYHAQLYDCDCDEDGFFGNGYAGSAESAEACMREIADIEEEKGLPLTPRQESSQ